MLAFDALVRGRVVYEAHNVPMRVPQGHCKVEAHEGFVSLSWMEDGQEHTAVLKVAEFEAYLEGGALLITDPAQIRRSAKVTQW
jgi:hypothetical protein